MPIDEFYTVDTISQKSSSVGNGREAKWTSFFTYAPNSHDLCELYGYSVKFLFFLPSRHNTVMINVVCFHVLQSTYFWYIRM